MAFTSFTSAYDAVYALHEFLYDREEAIPDELREKLKALVGPSTSMVNAVVIAAESIYANKGELHPHLLQLGAGLALVAEQFNFHKMGAASRGSKIALALLRDSGLEPSQGVTYPDEAQDPKPKTQFIVAEPESP